MITAEDTNTVPTKIQQIHSITTVLLTFIDQQTSSLEIQQKIDKQTSSINEFDDYGDTFWPVAIALTIGVPTIIVRGITITLLNRRRMHKRRGLLKMPGADYQNT